MLICDCCQMFLLLLIAQSFDHFLCQNSHPPGEGEPLGIFGALCCWHHLPHPTMHWAQESPVLLTFQLDASLSRPHIQSSTLQVPAEDWMAFPDPWGHPSPLAFIFFSMAASAIALRPSCTIFAVTSTCAILLAQLTGPVKLNSMSLALVYENPSLHDCLPKNKMASHGASTTTSVVHSLRPSCNMSTISDPLHVWEGGGWSPLP